MAIDTRTPAELEVAKSTEAALAAGKDPFGDDEEIVAPTISSQAADAAAELDEAKGIVDAVDPDEEAEPAAVTAEAKPEAATPSAEALAEIAADEQPVAALPKTPQFRVASQEAIEADMLALETEKADAFQKVMSGDMEPKDYTALEASVNRKIGRLQAQSTLAEANAQTAAQHEAEATLALMHAAKKSNELDYFADTKAQSQFDAFLNVALADPDNAGKPYAEILSSAHANVLAYRGIVKAAAPAVADEVAPTTTKPAARVPEPAPLTLRGLPNASVPNTGGTLSDALGRLTGAEYQAAFNKLTPAQKAAMVDD
jgi:hypothetical protein